MSSDNILPFPTNRRASARDAQSQPVESPANPAQQRCRYPYDPAKDSRGKAGGYREFRISTHRETRAWRDLARAHEEARQRLNALLPACAYVRAQQERFAPTSASLTHMRDHRAADKAAIEAATRLYRQACADILDYADPQPRHITTLIRCASELADAPDPVWSHAKWGDAESRADLALCYLYRQVFRALGEGE